MALTPTHNEAVHEQLAEDLDDQWQFAKNRWGRGFTNRDSDGGVFLVFTEDMGDTNSVLVFKYTSSVNATLEEEHVCDSPEEAADTLLDIAETVA